jgi:hypothetical protein
MSETGNYERALAWGRKNHPNSPEEHHQAFASLVVFAVEIPIRRYKVINTMRTYAGINKLCTAGQPGYFSFDEAVTLLEKDCYGPITEEHAANYRQCRFQDDYPEDINTAEALLANPKPILLSKHFSDREAD